MKPGAANSHSANKYAQEGSCYDPDEYRGADYYDHLENPITSRSDAPLSREQIESMRRIFTGVGNKSYTVTEKMMFHGLCDMALRSETLPTRDAVLEALAKIRTVQKIGPLAGEAWLAYKEGQADYAAAILQHKNAAPQVASNPQAKVADSDSRRIGEDGPAAAAPTVAEYFGATPKGNVTALVREVRELTETAGDAKNSDDYVGKVFRARVASLNLHAMYIEDSDDQRHGE